MGLPKVKLSSRSPLGSLPQLPTSLPTSLPGIPKVEDLSGFLGGYTGGGGGGGAAPGVFPTAGTTSFGLPGTGTSVIPPIQIPPITTIGGGGSGPIMGDGGILGGSGFNVGPWDVLGQFLDKKLGYDKEKVKFDPVDVKGMMGDYKGITDASGNLLPQYKLNQGNWAELAKKQSAADEQALLNQTAAQNASQLAGARSNLAMRGGLRGGAAERMAMQGAETNLLAGQDVRNQAMRNRLGIDTQAEQNRLGIDQFNIGNLLSNQQGLNDWMKSIAEGQIKATGAAQSAEATANAGKK